MSLPSRLINSSGKLARAVDCYFLLCNSEPKHYRSTAVFQSTCWGKESWHERQQMLHHSMEICPPCIPLGLQILRDTDHATHGAQSTAFHGLPPRVSCVVLERSRCDELTSQSCSRILYANQLFTNRAAVHMPIRPTNNSARCRPSAELRSMPRSPCAGALKGDQ